MQITKARLKQIIQEEFSRMNEMGVDIDDAGAKDVTIRQGASMGEISEDGHTDVKSAVRSMKLIIEDASQILEGLMQTPEGAELPSWWMNKVAVAKKDLNSCRDYFLVSEEAKPDFLDLDKDGDKEEPMKKAAKEAEQQNESLSGEEFQILYRKLQDVISNSDLSPTDKLNIKTILRNSDLKDRFEAELKGTLGKAAEKGDKMVPRSTPVSTLHPDDNPRSSKEFVYVKESQSPSDDLLETLIRKQLQKKTKISEALSLHIKEGVGIERNIFRPGSDSYFALINEARRQFKNGDYSPVNEEELDLLESDVGEFGIFEGEKVPLDFPMIVEAEYKGKKVELGKPTKNAGSGKKYKVFVRNPKTGNVKKITYGDSKGGLKGNWNNAEARASFAARHNCAEKKDRTKAGYWACRAHKDFGKNVPGRFW